MQKLYKTAQKDGADIVKDVYRYIDYDYINLGINDKIREFKTNFVSDFCSAIFRTAIIKENNIEFPILKDMEDPIFAFKASVIANKVELVDDAIINIVK